MIASDEGVVVGESEEVGKGLSHEDEKNSIGQLPYIKSTCHAMAAGF